MRQKLYEIIEVSKDGNTLSTVYDVFMMIIISLSIIPLAFKNHNTIFLYIDRITVLIFILDYFLRFITADIKIRNGVKSFILYLFLPMSLIDLISILPSLTVLNDGFRLFKIFRLLRTFRVFRIFKIVRYSKSITVILSVFRKQKESLLTICIISISYVLVSALIIFNIEPQTFNTYFDAVYWATVSLTTMGYGDIYPVTIAGRTITMISSFIGIAIVALPAGIITAGLMEEIQNNKRQ